jgi:hypothetical protein
MKDTGKETRSERRLAENEVLFRSLNQQVTSGFEETTKLAVEENQPEYTVHPIIDDEPLSFYCECADEKCTKRVKLNLHDYNEVHKDSKSFVIALGHEVTSVEDVILQKPGYVVVRKRVKPPKAGKLHPTSLNHTKRKKN